MTDSSRKTLDMKWMEKEVATGRGEAGAGSCVHQQDEQPRGAGSGHGASCGATAARAASRLSAQGGASLPHVGQQVALSVRNAVLSRAPTFAGAQPFRHGEASLANGVPSDLLRAARDALNKNGLVLAYADLTAAVTQAWNSARKTPSMLPGLTTGLPKRLSTQARETTS